MAAREHVGGARNAQRRSMGAHVPAIGEQRHRAEQRTRGDLGDHHDDGQGDHEPGPALVLRMGVTEEDVLMRPVIEGV